MPIKRTFNRSASTFKEQTAKFNNQGRKAKPRQLESQLQQCCVAWFRLEHPKLALLIFAVPNGGSRNVIEAAKMKREGVTAGVADLLLAIPCNGYHGLFIEMKTTSKTSKQTDTQKAFQTAVEAQGYKYTVCRTIEQFCLEITAYLEL